ncbi:hypothetical protein H2202_006656 [Exophiala xenobiotica]|nr:hypothetical protein H2202_006656 [Exophiala xenobiotica]KAK5235768.1 hypothetical protein LTR47_003242 [Exophiala xenobiotica]KAK5250445.1 hypothetical protein LTS06_004698 [Exophiala xenobiotica]KAK5280599.1 hypothetical protein LTR40_006118 [Exophiala xenobiotica]KAK5353999.1 hypothetical protein LTR61_002694 [Exophiala xenobiotica]
MMQNALTPALWLFVATLASAAPIADEPITTAGNNIGYGTGGGIAGLIILILDIIVIIEVLQSNRPASHKLLWILVTLLFPLIGMILYFLFSNRAAHKTGGSYEPIP